MALHLSDYHHQSTNQEKMAHENTVQMNSNIGSRVSRHKPTLVTQATPYNVANQALSDRAVTLAELCGISTPTSVTTTTTTPYKVIHPIFRTVTVCVSALAEIGGGVLNMSISLVSIILEQCYNLNLVCHIVLWSFLHCIFIAFTQIYNCLFVESIIRAFLYYQGSFVRPLATSTFAGRASLSLHYRYLLDGQPMLCLQLWYLDSFVMSSLNQHTGMIVVWYFEEGCMVLLRS